MRTTENGGSRDGERGQIMIVFTLVVVLLMALAAIVIDVSLLRTDGQRLQNALDAGALAAGHTLPVNNTTIAANKLVARDYTRVNYPGMPNANVPDPTAQYACLIGLDTATGLPRVADMPLVCNVSFGPTSFQWKCTTAVCWAPCDPVLHPTDVCNTVILTSNVTQPYFFGRAVGVNSGNTGVITSAACTGVCGNLPVQPVDVVILLDRTGSMDDSSSVDNLRSGARSALQAFDPALQRIALGFTGPTSPTRTTNGNYGNQNSSRPLNAAGNQITSASLRATACTPTSGYSNTVHAIAIDPDFRPAGPVPTFVTTYSNANASGGANTISIARPTTPDAVNVGDFLLAAIAVDDGDDVTIQTPGGWTSLNRTNNDDDVGFQTFYRFATSADQAAGNWTWNISSGTRAVATIVRYTGVNPADPIDGNSEDDGSTSFFNQNLQAQSIETDNANSALIGVFTANQRTSFTMANPTPLTEIADLSHPTVSSGPSMAIGRGVQANPDDTGDRNATIGSNGIQWATQLIGLNAVPGPADTYDQTDQDQWLPIGFTGLDTNTPAVTHREAYVDASNNPRPSTDIVQAIGCFDVSQVGTNLATPLDQARQYLASHGRRSSIPGIKQGIILETDGQPEHNSGQEGVGNWRTWATCADSTRAANAVKNADIELFTIGYGLESRNCPDGGLSATRQLASMATDSPLVNNFNCSNTTQRNAENTDGDHFFCTPEGGNLTDILHQAAVQLAGGTRLVQMYPTPIVSGVSPNRTAIGNTVTITGKYFTEAYAVTFGGVNSGGFNVISDTVISAVVPPGSGTVDVQVSTPGGTSIISSGDKFTYP
ncbi:MAG TPA: pilus assembly protein TadG-related protein [Candidatus Limnocylindrales bacterium]